MQDVNPFSDIFAVLTLNLRFGLADDGRNCWRNRIPALTQLLHQQSADIFCFQEANDFQVSEIREILHGHEFIGQRSPAPSFWQNNVIFYHPSFRCIRNNHFYLSPTPQIPSRFRESRWPRQCTLGVFRRRGRMLACADTHLDFDAGVQRRSAEIILDHLRALSPDMPWVLAGDFNATPQSDCYRIFEEAGLEMVFDFEKAGTYHGFSGTPRGGCIDWILSRGGVAPIRTWIIRDRYAGRYPSDHFPIRTEFAWKR